MNIKMSVVGMLVLGMALGCVADVAFISANGDWDIAGNWDPGRVPLATDQMKINEGRTVTIQSNTVATARNMLVGNNYLGTVVVRGSLDTAWNDIKLGVWGSGNGVLEVLGGIVGDASQRQKTIIGEGASDRGTLRIGDGMLGGTYYTDHLYMFNSAGMTETNRIDLQGGTLDAVGKTINVGYRSGTVATALMDVSNNATVKAGNLAIGNNANGTSGKLTVTGIGAEFDITGGFSLSENSRLEMVFDADGISTLEANKFWFSQWTSAMSVVGTIGISTGRYDLVTGLTGGTGENLPIVVSGFDGYTVEILSDTSGGQLTYYANITSEPWMDGVPVSWIFHYFGTTNGFSSSVDSDLDGMDNHGEYLADTDPSDPNSLIKMLGVKGTLGNMEVVYQNGGSNSNVIVEYRAGALSGWDVLATNEAPTAASNTYIHANTDTNGWYRIEAYRP